MARITAATLKLFADSVYSLPARQVDGAFINAGFEPPPKRRIVSGRESSVTFRSYTTRIRLSDLETQKRLVRACGSLLGSLRRGDDRAVPDLLAKLDGDGFVFDTGRLEPKSGTSLTVRVVKPRARVAAVALAPEYLRSVRRALDAARNAGIRAITEFVASMVSDAAGRIIDVSGEAWVYTVDERSDLTRALRRVGNARARDGVLCVYVATTPMESPLSARRAGAIAAASTLTRMLERPFRFRIRVDEETRIGAGAKHARSAETDEDS